MGKLNTGLYASKFATSWTFLGNFVPHCFNLNDPFTFFRRYLEIPVTDFCETSQIRPIIRLRALVTSFSRDIPSGCESYNIIILFTLCVILVL